VFLRALRKKIENKIFMPDRKKTIYKRDKVQERLTNIEKTSIKMRGSNNGTNFFKHQIKKCAEIGEQAVHRKINLTTLMLPMPEEFIEDESAETGSGTDDFFELFWHMHLKASARYDARTAKYFLQEF